MASALLIATAAAEVGKNTSGPAGHILRIAGARPTLHPYIPFLSTS